MELRVELARDLPRVRGNRIQLQQVVLNLLMNSRDAMASAARESRRLQVRSQKSPGEAGVVVTVKDSGIGIQPHEHNTIFNAFYTTKPRGMGLGLSISQSIIEAHGGRIWAVSNRGPGLTVKFSLPAESGSTP